MNTKRIFIILLLLATSALAFTQQIHAQQNRNIGYQALIRKADGQPLTNATVTVKITLNQATADGQQLYAESHEVQTSPSGLLSLEIGKKDPTTFSAINWATADAWLNIEVTGGGNDPVDIKMTQKLQAVPYALHAETVADLEKKADKTDVETIDTKVTTLEGKVTDNTTSIAGKADKTDVETIDTKVTTLEGKVKANTDNKADKAELAALVEKLQAELKMLKALPTVKKELQATQTAIRQAAIALFNSKPANVETHYVNDTLDDVYSESIYGVLTGGYEITDPKKGPTHGSYKGKMKLEFEEVNGELRMHMTENAMGLNELALYSVIWVSLAFWTASTPQITHSLNMCYFDKAGINLQKLCDILDWHKEPGKVGEMNLQIHNIKVLPPDENNISKIDFIAPYKDLYNEEYMGINFEFDYSPYNRMLAISKDPSHKYYTTIKNLSLMDEYNIPWANYTPWPQLYFGNIDFNNLLDFRPVSIVPEDEQITDISQITGQIDWNKKEITCRFPTAIEQGGIIYVDVKITAGE